MAVDLEYRELAIDLAAALTENARLCKAIRDQAGVELSEENDRLIDEIARLRAALTPSAETKSAYIGEFAMDLTQLDESGDEKTARITIPWTSVKEIMRAIQKYADEQSGDANG